ncbi:PAS domain-containing protein [Candidatus Poribacteria bacterium]|nr:PAS domain-containing protein [Candidatus Poribacteria bacterium]
MNCKDILNNISEGVLTLDTEMKIVDFNTAAEEITGFTAEEAVGKPCSQIFRTAMCKQNCPLVSVLETGNPIPNYDVIALRKDNTEIPLRISSNVLKDEKGELEGLVWNFRDATEIRNLMWEVVDKHTIALEENAKLEIILDSIAEGVFTINANWQIESFNAAAERITGFTADEAIGRPCYEVFRSDMCGENCALARSLETGEPVSGCEVNITSKDGKRVPISVSASVLVNDDGQVIGAVESFRDLSEIKRLTAEVHGQYDFSNIIGKSRDMQQIFTLIKNLSDTDATVLIRGESGTGKELVAKAIHYNSLRRDKPFVAVSCAALSENLLESELFGHVKGSFSGAVMNKAGRFEIADKGTLFLDEIGDISPNVQIKLLRVLESQEFERVGSVQTIKVDVRLIAATNKNLEKAIKEGDFREDLFYRLNVVPIYIPPLRERSRDVPLLVEHFIRLFNKKTGKEITKVSPKAMDLLLDYPWPGNVRELENAIEHAFVHCQTSTIIPDHLPGSLQKSESFIADKALSSDNPLEAAEKQVIQKALEENQWDQNRVMDLLGISRTTLWRKMHKYGIKRPVGL